MNIVEALFVTLGLDPSGLKKGAKEAEQAIDSIGAAADKAQGKVDESNKKSAESTKKAAEEEKKRQKAAEEANKKVEESYRKIRDSILEITAAVVAAVAGREFVKYLTDNDIAATKLATNVGSTAQDVLTLQTAFKRMGASGEEAGGTLRTINKILEDLKNTGTFNGIYAFQRAGFDVSAFRSAKTDLERMAQMAAVMKNMTPQDAQYFAQQAGFSEEAITLMIRQGDQLRSFLEDTRKLNELGPKDQEAAIKRADAYAKLAAQFESMGRKITTEVTPALEGAADAAGGLFGYLEGHLPVANSLAFTLGAAFVALNATSLAGIITKVGALTGGLSAAGAASATLLSVVSRLGLVAGVAGIVDAVLTAVDKNDNFGAWIDATVPFASDIDNAASHIGLGRSYAEQNAHYKRSATPATGAAPAGSGQWEALIQASAAKWGVSPDLIRAVIKQESKGNPNAVSNRGAVGLMQLMPGTAGGLGVSNSYDPAQNVDGGTHLLHDLLTQFGGNVQMALAGYNWGSGNLARYGFDRRPGETRGYIDAIMSDMHRGGSSGGGTNVSVGAVTIQTSSPTMEGAGRDLGKGILGRFMVAGQSNTGPG